MDVIEQLHAKFNDDTEEAEPARGGTQDGPVKS